MSHNPGGAKAVGVLFPSSGRAAIMAMVLSLISGAVGRARLWPSPPPGCSGPALKRNFPPPPGRHTPFRRTAPGCIRRIRQDRPCLHSMANQRASIDFGRRSGEPDAPATAAQALHKTGSGEAAHHLHQVILRDAVRLRDLADRAQPVLMGCQIEYHPNREISETRQPHGSTAQ